MARYARYQKLIRNHHKNSSAVLCTMNQVLMEMDPPEPQVNASQAARSGHIAAVSFSFRGLHDEAASFRR
eukprot:scaffold3767_cov116-Skeletonema_menzelii.AAC.5